MWVSDHKINKALRTCYMMQLVAAVCQPSVALADWLHEGLHGLQGSSGGVGVRITAVHAAGSSSASSSSNMASVFNAGNCTRQ
jgi:hypothetical protein